MRHDPHLWRGGFALEADLTFLQLAIRVETESEQMTPVERKEIS